MAKKKGKPSIANNYELKLDVYRPTTAKAPTPVVMLIHGGGWVRHEKEEEVLSLLPYLEMGWAAVNVEYRLARVSLAPAAVEDCRCALHWIGRNAKKYNFDVSKVVVTGASNRAADQEMRYASASSSTRRDNTLGNLQGIHAAV
jgi:acetyl esterase/lipase